MRRSISVKKTMTIEKGEDWGHRALFPDDAPIVDGDAELAALFSVTTDDENNQTLTGPSVVGLKKAIDSSKSHDLATTVSARGSETDLRTGERTHLPIDLGVVSLDGALHVMAASLVIRTPLWTRVVQGAMNASFLGDWNVTPSGHPNDGRFDIVRAELTLGDRFKARSRLASGSHVPHPDISIRRLRSHDFEPVAGAQVRIDGQNLGAADDVSVTVIADATTIVI